LIFSPFSLTAQNNVWHSDLGAKVITKLSPQLKKASLKSNTKHRNPFLIEISDTAAFSGYYQKNISRFHIIRRPLPHFVIISCSAENLKDLLINEFLVFADNAELSPVTEGYVISHDLSVNAIHATHQKYTSDNGSAEVVSVKEDRMDSADIDLAKRFVRTGIESTVGSTHATSMTTLIAGAGNSSFKGTGVARGASYASSDFSGALPDNNLIYRTYQINIQNHSYGIGIQNYYGANARAFDLSTLENPSLTHVFSSGNSGASTSTDGRYAGVEKYANLTGNMKMAKNVLVVGAIDSNGIVPAASSRGPAYDGRVKPDLVAFAEDGSSGSAALVSGAVAVLQNIYKKTFGSSAASDIMRAALINSADDIDKKGPDFISGYGNLNLYRAVQTLKDNRIHKGLITPFSEDELLITIPDGVRNFKITLVWNDPAAAALSPVSLINDLDLTVEHKTTAQHFKPWVLNIYPHPDSLSLPAIQGVDTINNTEQVTIDDPQPGQYAIRIKSTLVQGGSQSYALAWQYDSSGKFEWMYPSHHAKIEAGKVQTVRWFASLPDNVSGRLEWSTDSLNWRLINENLSLLERNAKWDIPDTISTAWIRIKSGTEVFCSDRFVINPIPDLLPGYVCDSTLWYWNNPLQHNLWRVYRFNGELMSIIKETSDTSFVLPTDKSAYYAVAPVIDGVDGLRSAAENSNQSGVGCYINNFLVDLVDDAEVRIRITLGSLYGMQSVAIEKTGLSINQIFKDSVDINPFYEITDNQLTQGINSYRLKIILADGSVIYSAEQKVYYSADRQFLIFPIPAARGEVIKLLQKEANEITVDISDATGRWIKKYSFQDTVNEIPTGTFTNGFYLLKVTDSLGRSYLYKIIVL
jgi:hypothetical protein